LTPEKSILLQLRYGADIVICLDDCTHADDPYQVQVESVERTIDWARRSKIEYLRIIDQMRIPELERPLVFAVIQGGGSFELRKRCAEALLEIGFDGYGFGGWPLDGEGRLLTEVLAYTRELVPSEFPLHALGVAHPANVVECFRLGYDLFDGAMPTRDARHGRLYVGGEEISEGGNTGYIYAMDDKHTRANIPVMMSCDCPTCVHYSLGYLHHLFDIGDTLALRLATLHNLRFMTRLVARLRLEKHA
jgi:queuine tRNA-ribosyltransferase